MIYSSSTVIYSLVVCLAINAIDVLLISFQIWNKRKTMGYNTPYYLQ